MNGVWRDFLAGHTAARHAPDPSSLKGCPMSTSRFSGAVVAAVVSLFAAPVFAEPQVFTLHNETSMVMMQFFASPSSSEEWGDDMFGDDVLEAGGSGDVTVDDAEGCEFDIKMVFDSGDEMTDTVDVCEITDYSATE